MPSEINRNPRGIIELTDLNRQGLFPRVLGDEIQPTLETSPFYFAGRGLEYALVTQAGILLPGQVATIPVPLGQVWAIRGVSIRTQNLDAAASTNLTTSCLAFAVPGSFTTLWTSPAAKTVAANNFSQEGRTFEVPILIAGGTTVSFNIDNIAAGFITGHTLNGSIAFYRLTT